MATLSPRKALGDVMNTSSPSSSPRDGAAKASPQQRKPAAPATGKVPPSHAPPAHALPVKCTPRPRPRRTKRPAARARPRCSRNATATRSQAAQERKQMAAMRQKCMAQLKELSALRTENVLLKRKLENGEASAASEQQVCTRPLLREFPCSSATPWTRHIARARASLSRSPGLAVRLCAVCVRVSASLSPSKPRRARAGARADQGAPGHEGGARHHHAGGGREHRH